MKKILFAFIALSTLSMSCETPDVIFKIHIERFLDTAKIEQRLGSPHMAAFNIELAIKKIEHIRDLHPDSTVRTKYLKQYPELKKEYETLMDLARAKDPWRYKNTDTE